jgi:8-oxo-dGTP pyrophosphatase MutT (NUDIX family)
MPSTVDFAVIYVVRDDHRVLQLKRSPDLYLGGEWSFPGGHVEQDEHPAVAAVRELAEETGITAADTHELTYVSHVTTLFSPAWASVCHRVGFCAKVSRDCEVTLNDEHTDLRWISRGEIRQQVLWPGERAQLAEIFREHLRPAEAHRLRKLDVHRLARGEVG